MSTFKEIRNHIGWRERLGRLQGVPIEFDLRSFDAELDAIARMEADLCALSDDELRTRARVERERTLFFAIVREAARRVIGLRPFDVQVVAALALDRGRVVEMQTGEGKTLAAVMPAAFNALTGRGVHVLTFNDYLARRDAEWMGPLYRFLGLSVGVIQQDMNRDQRQQAYHADVTYVTATEAGFDHLRDLLAYDAGDLVHRPFHFAIVDEADSLLIDEARVPLVIAGSVDRDVSSAPRLAAIVASLTPGVDYTTDEYGRDAELTDTGLERAEAALGCGNLHEERNYRLLTELNCALHAEVLLHRDVDYIVRDGRIDIVDEFTGRVVPDRHWPDGLQTALEAKEGLHRRSDGCTLGSITLQHFIQGYPRVAGMTGTARDAAVELRQMYGLDVVVIPTHRPMIRIDRPDIVFTHRAAKEEALVGEIRRARSSGRPVLVGTLTIDESERLAAQLRSQAIACEVLNAKHDSAEAGIVADAGAIGAVTISTNMAGRGTDVRLGGADESQREAVVALGGLYVIGTNRHESRRVDLQLRGRAGRQGDPGESQFFVSLDDDLLVRYGIRDLIPNSLIPDPRSAPIDHPIVAREIARAQRIIEGQNLEIRKTLWRYASVVEEQRRRIVTRRQAAFANSGRVERSITLYEIDRAWREHLALCADLREGIHLVSLGGQDPLTRFTTDTTGAFDGLEATIPSAVCATLDRVRPLGEAVDLDALGIRGPSSTWTYLVNDDPFRNQMGVLLTGPGRATIAIYSGIFFMPLLILWGLVDRYWRRKGPG